MRPAPAAGRVPPGFFMANDSDIPPRVRMIAASAEEVRLVCEACGAHMVIEKRRLGPAILCTTCDAPRLVIERRSRDIGHAPERRTTLPSV